ncbi:MAG: D-hexose-6-phosphate mutarotase [Kiritimatiellae bacterium]|nr:D-hexose-6-phosphate mutarotase [Kiritimatiellia bacterium]
MIQDLDFLNRKFGAPGRIAFRERSDGFPVAVLAGRYGTCEVSVVGAQVLTYRPVGLGPALFVSKAARFEPGKPIRGGIPVCWPWFGKADGLPNHGFARTSRWTVVGSAYSGDETEISLRLLDDEATRALWPHRFEAKLEIKLGESLQLNLAMANPGDAPFSVTQGFHPYLLVRDLADAEIRRLGAAKVVDLLNGDKESVLSGTLTLTGAADMVVSPGSSGYVLYDRGLDRSVLVTFKGARKLVVWNPGAVGTSSANDMESGEERRFLCVEPVCFRGESVTLKPGETSRFSMALQVLQGER